MTSIDPAPPGVEQHRVAVQEPVPRPSGPGVPRRRKKRPYRSWVRRLFRPPSDEFGSTLERTRQILPLSLAVIAATIGQYYFIVRRDFFWDGVTFYGIGCIFFLVALAAPRARAPRQPSTPLDLSAVRAWARRYLLQIGLFTVGALLVLVVGLRAASGAPADSTPLFVAWLLGCAGMLAAFVPADALERAQAWTRHARTWLQPGRPAFLLIALLAGVLLLGAGVRLLGLETVPVNLSGDEGTQGLWSRDFLSQGGAPAARSNMFETGPYGTPTMTYYYNALGLRLLGDHSALALRVPWALLGTLALLFTFLLVREWWHNNWLALLAAFLLAVGHYQLHFSRLGSAQVADSLFITLSLWLFARAERTRGPFNFVLAGAALGLGLYFGARVAWVVLLVYALYRVLRAREYWLQYRTALLAMLAVAVLVAFPLLRSYQLHPDTWDPRYTQTGIIPSGWLQQEAQRTGKSEVELWVEQFRKSVAAFNYEKDPTSWYGADRPLLDSLTAIVFVLGLVLTLARIKRPPYAMLAAWFWLTIFFGWVLNENPPGSFRALAVAPAVMIMAAIAAWELGSAVLRVWPRGMGYVAPAFLVAVTLLNLNFYFREYTPSAVYGNANAEIATLLGRQLAQQPDANYHVYFFAAPVMYFDAFGSVKYLAPAAQGTDVNDALAGPPHFPVDPARQRALFVFLPHRAQEESLVTQAYPGGCPSEVYRNNSSEIAYYLYAYPCPSQP